VEEFANALSNLLESVERRAALGRAAFARCREMFDWDIVARQWFTMIETGAGHSC
jgi:glycosyltransferase involved in cell wall biosynthesis